MGNGVGEECSQMERSEKASKKGVGARAKNAMDAGSACVYRGVCFFFFQAEDGIRDLTVTGVQTCALPIYRFVIILLVDDVTDRARTSELQHERVHPTDMIRHKKKSAVWQVVEADRADSIKSAHEWAANGVEHTFSGRFRKHRL